MREEIFLIDLLTNAVIEAPAANYVEIQRMNMERQSRSALFQHPDSKVTFNKLALGQETLLKFETGIAESVWDRFKGVIVFEIFVQANEVQERIFEFSMTTHENLSDRGWKRHEVDLDKYKNSTISLIFSTKALNSSKYAWSAWANPAISHLKPKKQREIRKDTHRHLFIITADAMSKRFFGCYGSREVKTPHIDRLAEESVIFDDAWSNSTTTPGSYATLWSGLHPKNHHLISEWGPFPAGVPSLPVIFNGHGYHTAMFTGEAELSHPKFGFSSLFNETHGAIANPAQDGAITIRNFEKWLQQRPDKPLMTWLQFFDTHPPNLPPGEYSAKYYSGDPEKTGSEPEKVNRVYGIESMVEFDRTLPWIKKGMLSGQASYRFWETIRAFKGKQKTGPDLYEHLKHMNPKARLEMKDADFGKWLESQVSKIENDRTTSPEFIDWIEYVQKELAFIQGGIINWLKNVKDFNYPISQYKGCMTYFDHLVGKFTEILKRERIYENSTIIIVSPHGEILSYDDAIFHHHMPHPNVLSIPMIIKMAGENRPARIKGIMNLMDLSPTIAEMFFGDNPFITDGVSRWKNIIAGSEIPEKFSIAFDIANTLKSVASPPHFYFRADDEYIITPTKYGHAGDDFLFKITDDEYGLEALEGHEEIKAILKEKLKEFDL